MGLKAHAASPSTTKPGGWSGSCSKWSHRLAVERVAWMSVTGRARAMASLTCVPRTVRANAAKPSSSAGGRVHRQGGLQAVVGGAWPAQRHAGDAVLAGGGQQPRDVAAAQHLDALQRQDAAAHALLDQRAAGGADGDDRFERTGPAVG